LLTVGKHATGTFKMLEVPLENTE